MRGTPRCSTAWGWRWWKGIAALGALDYRALGLSDFGKPDNYLARQVSRWKAQLESYGEFADWTGPQELPELRGSRIGWTRIALRASSPASCTATITSPT